MSGRRRLWEAIREINLSPNVVKSASVGIGALTAAGVSWIGGHAGVPLDLASSAGASAGSLSQELLAQLGKNYAALKVDPVPPEGTVCYAAIADATMAPGYIIWVMASEASEVLHVLPQYYASADAAALMCRALAPPGSAVDRIDADDRLAQSVWRQWLAQRPLYPGADARPHRVLPYHVSGLTLADGSTGWFAWQEAIQPWGPDYMVLSTDYSASTVRPAFTMTADHAPVLFETPAGVRQVLADELAVSVREVPLSPQTQIPPGLQRQLHVTQDLTPSLAVARVSLRPSQPVFSAEWALGRPALVDDAPERPDTQPTLYVSRWVQSTSDQDAFCFLWRAAHEPDRVQLVVSPQTQAILGFATSQRALTWAAERGLWCQVHPTIAPVEPVLAQLQVAAHLAVSQKTRPSHVPAPRW